MTMWCSRCRVCVAAAGERRSLAVRRRRRKLVAVAQGRAEDHPRANGTERETASHAAHLLRRQPAPGRADEGTTGRDDRSEFARHPRLVPEQALQGQETVGADEADTAAAGKGSRLPFLCLTKCLLFTDPRCTSIG